MKQLVLAALVASLPISACSNMTPGQQRALGGTAIGASGGAILGAIGGNAALGAGLGAAAGLAGGLIYNQVKSGN
jgi:Glycine-zipper domain